MYAVLSGLRGASIACASTDHGASEARQDGSGQATRIVSAAYVFELLRSFADGVTRIVDSTLKPKQHNS
jgi:hypothetical protein